MKIKLIGMLVWAVAACGGGGRGDHGVDGAPPGEPDGGGQAACDTSGLPAYAPVPVDTAEILPSVTGRPGEAIDDQVPVTRHLVVRPAGATSCEKLFVWLPGTGAEPIQFEVIMNVAAAAGYCGVSLAYMNEISVLEACNRQIDLDACDDEINLDCYEQAREELIYGDGTTDSPCVEVSRDDSIEHRVLRLIQHLDGAYPDAGLDRFLTPDGEGLAWEEIAFGGWSQGGGHTGVIARDHLIARALYVSRAADSVDENLDGVPDPAPWAFDARQTPPGREFASVHESEGLALITSVVLDLWGISDLGGGAINVDGLTGYPAAYADYRCTHAASTNATPACGATDFHKAPAVDACLSLGDDGVAILAHAYFYFLSVDVP